MNWTLSFALSMLMLAGSHTLASEADSLFESRLNQEIETMLREVQSAYSYSGKWLLINIHAFEKDVFVGTERDKKIFNAFAGEFLGSIWIPGMITMDLPRFTNSPSVIVSENQPFTVSAIKGFFSISEGAVEDREIQYGFEVEGVARCMEDGRIHLNVSIKDSALDDYAWNRIQLTTRSSRMIATVDQGEGVVLHWREGDPRKRAWAVITVEEYPQSANLLR